MYSVLYSAGDGSQYHRNSPRPQLGIPRGPSTGRDCPLGHWIRLRRARGWSRLHIRNSSSPHGGPRVEVAKRVLSGNHRAIVYSFRSSYSVIFVAFDKNHDGKIGSKRFISEYLIPHVVNKYGCRVQVVKITITARKLNLLVRLFSAWSWTRTSITSYLGHTIIIKIAEALRPLF